MYGATFKESLVGGVRLAKVLAWEILAASNYEPYNFRTCFMPPYSKGHLMLGSMRNVHCFKHTIQTVEAPTK